jgi:hypothetical protein
MKTKKYFGNLSDQELIDAFNREVGNPGWTSGRATYLGALQKEFQSRNLDYSEIGNKRWLSFARKIKLIGKKISIDK